MAENELILISHGNMAEGVKASAELIMGEQEHVHAVCLLPSEGPDDFKQKFEKEIAGINPENITVFADLMGGTPANVVSQMIMTGEQIHLIAGMNLPLVIEWLNSQMNGMASDYITAGKAGMVDVTEMLVKMKK
jgi:mannose PTS system EIIA component